MADDRTDINSTKSREEVTSKSIHEVEVTPIRSLTSFVPDWKIKARISSKGEIKHWNNDRGSGYLMNINLIDSHGDQIQATFFKEAVDKFSPILEEN